MLSFIIRKILQNLSFFFTNDMRDVKKKDKKLYKEISILLEKDFKKSKNLKHTHNNFNKQIFEILKKGKIYNFLRNSFIQKMFFVHNRLFIIKELNILKTNKRWKFYKKLLAEDNVGNPVRYFLYPKSSGNKINHVYHLSLLEDYLKIDLSNIKYVFEFGGGYGCMARIFFQINKNIKYLIFDTKLVNLLQFYYLQQNKINAGFKNRNQFILKNEIKNVKIEKKKKSLFIANWSLSETPINFRNKFLRYIQNYQYIYIAFQEQFEGINNKKYFYYLEKKLKKKYKIYLFENKFYKGNIFNKHRHYFFIGKKINDSQVFKGKK